MVNASFVFGLDADDPSVFGRTVDWVVRNRIETVTAHILTPYPGTVFHWRMEEAGRQIAPYLLFNLLYRKYGSFTERLGRLVGFARVGRLSRWLAYLIR